MQATSASGMKAYGLRPPEAMSSPATSRVSSPGAKGSGTPASSAKSSDGRSASATAPCRPWRKFTGPSSPEGPDDAARAHRDASRFCESPAVADAEVVVVGAGPSGATAALLLARKGHRVVVIDRARFPRDKACGEGLLPPGVEVIRRLGLLDTVLSTGAQPLEGVTYQHEGGGPSAYAAFPPPPSGGPVAG